MRDRFETVKPAKRPATRVGLAALAVLCAVVVFGFAQKPKPLPKQQWEKYIVLYKAIDQNMGGYYLIDHTRKLCFFVLDTKGNVAMAEVNCKKVKKK